MGRTAQGWKLYKRPDSPIWWTRATVDGVRYRESTGFKDKGEAARWAEQWYSRLVAGQHIERSDSLPLIDLLSSWLTTVERDHPHWSSTVELYAKYWLKRWRQLDQIDSPAVERYIRERRGKVKAVTVRKELSALRRFLKWCQRTGHIQDLPEWLPPSTDGDREHTPVWLTADQMNAVIEELPESYRGHPVRAWFTVVWETSLRRATVARMRWEDLDFDAGTLSIRAKADKKRYGRTVPLTHRAVAVLRSLKKKQGKRSGLVFGLRDYRGNIRSAAKRAGVPEELAKKMGNHSVRHSRLTDWCSKTKDIPAVQYLAGHKLLQSTQRYVHADQERARKLLAALGE